MATRPTTTITAGAGGTLGSEGATFLNNLNTFSGQLFGGSVEQNVEISGGAVTPAAGYPSLVIDTEGDADTDTLNTINITNYANGNIILIRTLADARDVFVAHEAGGDGNISLQDNETFGLVGRKMCLILQLTGTTWKEVTRSYGLSADRQRSALGLGDFATAGEASTVEAQAGTSSTKIMTPRRVVDALNDNDLMIAGRTQLLSLDVTTQFLVEDDGVLYRLTRNTLRDSLGGFWDSGEISMPSQEGQLTISGDNAFTAPAKSFTAWLVCKQSDAGYSVNDYIDPRSVTGFSVYLRGSLLKWSYESSVSVTRENGGTSGALSLASRWRLRVFAQA